MRKDFIISLKYTNRSSGGVEAPKKLHSPVKHCGLSSRRSRVQIPAGASLFVEDDINIDKNIVKTNQKIENSLTLNIKSNPIDADKIVPNSVRYNKQQDLWPDFKEYLIAQKQSKSSLKNMGVIKIIIIA
jgi:hypothetical protein